MPGPPPSSRPIDEDAQLDNLAATVSSLGGLAVRPVAEHVPAFESVHTAMTQALSSIDKV
jgi:hypothetical protein